MFPSGFSKQAKTSEQEGASVAIVKGYSPVTVKTIPLTSLQASFRIEDHVGGVHHRFDVGVGVREDVSRFSSMSFNK